ncbi:hypothetical protein WICPIJ_004307 [Wickerhamomyces pijperi]|uniref:RNA polymerase-associated protein CTR9 n=1 Tax=Wickerhamomyces pijperi TaxID=599730 RepID=A0A9P8TMW7_WICPI|nr:hypothetical protein WICPIJ_004307 [Wickerhamomyces pijperi]
MSQSHAEDTVVNDATYYVKEPPTYLTTSFDVPTKDTKAAHEYDDSEPTAPEFVTFDFEEIEDPSDLVDFLKAEEPGSKYWILMGAALSDKAAIELTSESATENLINSALETFSSGSDNLAVHNFRAWFYIRKSNNSSTPEARKEAHDLALQSVNHVINIDRYNALASLAQAEIFYQQEDYERALDLFDRVIKSENEAASRRKQSHSDEKSDVEVYASLGRAKILFKRKNYSASLRQFQAVLMLRPLFNPDARIGIGMNFWRLKDKALAVSAWERALQVNPANKTAKVLLTLAKFDSSFNALVDDDFVERYSAALDSLNKLLKSDPSDPVALLLLASYYYSVGQYNSVMKIAEQVLSLGHKLSPVLRSDANFWIARVKYEEKDHVNAQKFYTEASKASPENVLSKLGWGQAQYRRNQVDDSIITFEAILNNNEKLLEANYLLGVLYSEREETQDKAIKCLERYVRLAQEKNEPIILNAYLTLSKVYETKDINAALSYLSKSLELLQSQGLKDIPIEILNNLGVFHFVKGNPSSAKTFFESARSANTSDELEITLLFNEARALETTDETQATDLYNLTLEKAPGYVYSQIRLLYLSSMKTAKGKEDEELAAKVDALLASNPSNLQIRAFYSWYLHRTGRPNNAAGENVETKHNKETLTKYDSHDTYALITLGNLYCSIAREVKGKTAQDIDRKNQYYVRGANLFQKVLSLDPKNIYAAQGIAIIFVENKLSGIALETFRKIRDAATDDPSVYVNLGHCLLEVGQHAKAIDCYDIALKRFGDETKDSKYLTLIARGWCARGSTEKSLESFLKALEFSKKSLDVATANGYSKLIPSLKYNIAFVQSQMALLVLKLELSQRTVEDISKTLEGVEESIATFEALTTEQHPPLSVEILTERVNMAKANVTRLSDVLEKQTAYETQFQSKIQEAKAKREEWKKQQDQLERERKEEEEKKEAEKREMNKKLQEQAANWESERSEIKERLEQDMANKKSKRKEAVLTDEEFSGAEGEGDEKSSTKAARKTSVKRPRKKKDNVIEDDEDEDKEVKKQRKSNKVYKSADIIEDSDEDMSDFVEKDDEEEDEKSEAEKKDDDDNEDEGLF